MTSPRIPRPVSGVRLEQLDNERLLYHPGLTKTVHLSETASLIWQLCDGHRSTHQIAELLQEAFPDQEPEITRDVERVLERLAAEGAIEFA